jgi:2',3'-cyclic-nucleotide 2'-phosphodiesterase (5'-nucleotidase family)
MKLTILHTNDIHSRFENFSKISTKIRELRDECTLVLDAGDFNDFMSLELQGTNGRAGGELLDIAGYDAIAIGNNEGFEGVETTESLACSGKVPFLSCNLYKINKENYNSDALILEELQEVKRSMIIEKGGIRILVIGSSPYGSYNQFYNLLNMQSTDVAIEVRKEIISNKGKYDLCILLSHCGMREDTEIANHVEGIDIIINGHSHILMEEPVRINNTIVHMSGQYGEHLGVLEIEYDSMIKSFTGKNINIKDEAMDRRILESLALSKEKAIKNLSVPLYNIDVDLWHDVMEESPICNLLADSLRDLLKCDIGIINGGVLNGGIRKGPISKKKLLEICPSPLNPTYMEMLGKDIREALEKSLAHDFCLQDGKGSGFRGRYLGKLHISGGYIEHNCKTIKRIVIGESELQDEMWYKVATSDYLQRGTGYNSLSNNKNAKYNAEYLRDTLREYLKNKSIINESFKDRWIMV